MSDLFDLAPTGQIYVCATCGKRSRDRAGEAKIDSGWDESCMLHAVLVYEEKQAVTNGEGETRMMYVAVKALRANW